MAAERRDGFGWGFGDGGVPWMSALDPAANARALGDIQRRGLRAASEIVERLVAAVDGVEGRGGPGGTASDVDWGTARAATGGRGPGDAEVDGDERGGDAAGDADHRHSGGPAGRDNDSGGFARGGAGPDIDGLVDLWAELTKRSLHALVRLAGTGGAASDAGTGTGTGEAARGSRPAAPSTIDVEASGPVTPLRLAVQRDTVPPTDTSTGDASAGGVGEVWLHNGADGERDDLRFHCGELRRHDGGVLPGQVVFDPPVVERLLPRSSRGVLVTVADLDPAVEAGSYRGIVLVSGLPDVWLPIEVVVEP